MLVFSVIDRLPWAGNVSFDQVGRRRSEERTAKKRPLLIAEALLTGAPGRS